MSTITTITMVASPLGLALFVRSLIEDNATTSARQSNFSGGSLAIVILITGLVKLLKLDLKEAKFSVKRNTEKRLWSKRKNQETDTSV